MIISRIVIREWVPEELKLFYKTNCVETRSVDFELLDIFRLFRKIFYLIENLENYINFIKAGITQMTSF